MDNRKLDYETFWGGDLILEDAKEATKRWNAYPELVEIAKEYKMHLNGLFVEGRLNKNGAAFRDKIQELMDELNEPLSTPKSNI